MTEQQRRDAIEYIEGQLKNGYVDLSFHDEDEIEVIKEAINLLKAANEFKNNLPVTMPQWLSLEYTE